MTYPGYILGMQTAVSGISGETLALAPSNVEEVASILRFASETHKTVDVRGGGTHHGFGSPPTPDIVLSMEKFDRIEAWDPDDLTVVVGAGIQIQELEDALAERSQSAVLPEIPGASTVGGAISAGLSSLRRGRLLGTRERLLEVTLVTGDGRIVRGGGRVVKNVTGYDLPRLVVGAFGSLGVVTSLCLKLWPVPPAAATLVVEDFPTVDAVSRPLALLETNDLKTVHIWGTEAEVNALSSRVGGRRVDGLDWPADPSGPLRWSLRVPPSLTVEAISRIPGAWRYLAIHSVGEIRLASDFREGAVELRAWAESEAGHLVVAEAPPGALPGFDPWGKTRPGLELQKRIVAQFDPMRIINPGRLPGGI